MTPSPAIDHKSSLIFTETDQINEFVVKSLSDSKNYFIELRVPTVFASDSFVSGPLYRKL